MGQLQVSTLVLGLLVVPIGLLGGQENSTYLVWEIGGIDGAEEVMWEVIHDDPLRDARHLPSRVIPARGTGDLSSVRSNAPTPSTVPLGPYLFCTLRLWQASMLWW